VEYPFRKTRNEDEHLGVKSGVGAEITIDAMYLLSKIFLVLSFLRVLCVLRGE